MSSVSNPFDQHSFVNPWSLRVFAVTIAAAERELFTLKDFQQALIARIQEHEAKGQCIDSDESYYTRWIEALTDLLTARGLLADVQLQSAEQRVRDALVALRHAQDPHEDHAHGHNHIHTHQPERPDPRPLIVEGAL